MKVLGPMVAALCGVLVGCVVLLVGAMVALVIAEEEMRTHD